jgi:hypothetical protein
MGKDDGRDDQRWVDGTLEAGADDEQVCLRWVDGTLEAGADDEQGGPVPNPQTGVGIGAGEPSTFEPEEDRDAAEQPE